MRLAIVTGLVVAGIGFYVWIAMRIGRHLEVEDPSDAEFGDHYLRCVWCGTPVHRANGTHCHVCGKDARG